MEILHRNRIYKEILARFDEVQSGCNGDHLAFGLCAYFLTAENPYKIEDFPEIMKHKPKGYSPLVGYWFHYEGKQAIERRRDILLIAIEETNPKSNNQMEKEQVVHLKKGDTKDRESLYVPMMINIENLVDEPNNVEIFGMSAIPNANAKITMQVAYNKLTVVDGSVSVEQRDIPFSDVVAWVNQNKPQIIKIVAVLSSPDIIAKSGMPPSENIWLNYSDIFGFGHTMPIELKHCLVHCKRVSDNEGDGFNLNMHSTITIPFAKSGKITLMLYRDKIVGEQQ